MDKLIDFKKLKPGEKILLVGLITAIVFGLYSQGIYKPLSRMITRDKFQAEKYESRLNDLRVKSPRVDKQKQNIQSLSAQCKKLSEEIVEIEKTLPGKGDTSPLLAEFTRRTREVKLVSIRQKVETAGEYPRIFIELKFIAPYKETINCIRRIEAISPFLAIEELDISEPKGPEASGGAGVRLVVSSLLGEMPPDEQLLIKEIIGEDITVARDPFISRLGPGAQGAELKDLKLEGITFNQENPTAIINGEVKKAGSLVGNFRVKEILKDAVILSDGLNKDYTLPIER